MKIKTININTFELIDEFEILGYLSYDNMFSFNAIISIGDKNFKITPTGIFSNKISITKNDIEFANLKMNWKGQIIINFLKGDVYILYALGTFHNKYVVEDTNRNKIVELNPNFNWSNFNYNYIITYDSKPKDILLILLATYSANYYISAMSAAI